MCLCVLFYSVLKHSVLVTLTERYCDKLPLTTVILQKYPSFIPLLHPSWDGGRKGQRHPYPYFGGRGEEMLLLDVIMGVMGSQYILRDIPLRIKLHCFS